MYINVLAKYPSTFKFSTGVKNSILHDDKQCVYMYIVMIDGLVIGQPFIRNYHLM